MAKTGNRVRRTDGLQSRLAERDVASSAGLPGLSAGETSSGDSARGEQNGAAPQGRASSKRPRADQPKPKSKLMPGQLGRTKGKPAAEEEAEPPVKGRLQRIKERLEQEERERLEKGSSNTSSEVARAGSGTGPSGQEQGALASKGPSRLGPGRTNSSSLAAEHPAAKEAGKPSRKHALQVGHAVLCHAVLCQMHAVLCCSMLCCTAVLLYAVPCNPAVLQSCILRV